MSAARPSKTVRGARRAGQSGQAIVEYAISAIVMATLAFGVVDFSRAIYQQQVITSLAAQGANLAMRGGPNALNATASTVISDSQNLKLGTYGRVIVTAAYNNASAVQVTGQATQGGITASSKVGSVGGAASLPAGAVPPANQTMYVAEVFYAYQPITPVGKLLKAAMPVQLYDVAYY
jgi:Flp pilus assembly protein TadG